MITAVLILKDEDGKIVCQQEFDAMQPFQWRAPQDRPITIIEERDAKNPTEICWNLFGWTVQPMTSRELRRKR